MSKAHSLRIFSGLGGLLAAGLMLHACSKLPGTSSVPGVGGVGGNDGNSLESNACGDLSGSEVGRKYMAFIDASADLQKAATSVESTIKDACIAMGRELQLTAAQLSGDTKTICTSAFATLSDFRKVGIKAGANVNIKYTPAVCTVNMEAAASAAAKCEGKATADIAVQCSGQCDGTCSGKCDGACAGSSKSGTSCNSQCDGTCEGTCQGQCRGHADVKADGQCRAKAEVAASIEATCTPAKLDVSAKAGVMIDKAKAEAAFAAMRAGIPTILSAGARLESLGAATRTWAEAAGELAGAGRDLASEFRSQAMCFTGQVAAVARSVTQVNASISVSVEVSASASGSVGAN